MTASGSVGSFVVAFRIVGVARLVTLPFVLTMTCKGWTVSRLIRLCRRRVHVVARLVDWILLGGLF